MPQVEVFITKSLIISITYFLKLSESVPSDVVITGTITNSEGVSCSLKSEVSDGEYVAEDIKCFLERKHERENNLE